MTIYTTNYNLDKYEGTDKPNLRDQYNSAMDKIDTELKDLADTDVQTSTNVLNLQNRMNTAESNITNLQGTTASHTQQISDVTATANNALSLAQTNEGDIAGIETDVTQLKTTVSGNTTMLSAHAESLTTLESQMASTINGLSELGTNVESVTIPLVSTVQGCTVSGSVVIRKNTKLHIANFDGLISVTNTTGSQVTINNLTLATQVPANFRPATERTLSNLLMGYLSVTISGVNASRFGLWSPKLTTDGQIVAFENDSLVLENGQYIYLVVNQYLLFTNQWGPNY